MTDLIFLILVFCSSCACRLSPEAYAFLHESHPNPPSFRFMTQYCFKMTCIVKYSFDILTCKNKQKYSKLSDKFHITKLCWFHSIVNNNSLVIQHFQIPLEVTTKTLKRAVMQLCVRGFCDCDVRFWNCSDRAVGS